MTQSISRTLLSAGRIDHELATGKKMRLGNRFNRWNWFTAALGLAKAGHGSNKITKDKGVDQIAEVAFAINPAVGIATLKRRGAKICARSL